MIKIDEIKDKLSYAISNFMSYDSAKSLVDIAFNELKPYLIQWHKYPDEKPIKDNTYLCYFKPDGLYGLFVYIGYWINDDGYKLSESPDYWAEILECKL